MEAKEELGGKERRESEELGEPEQQDEPRVLRPLPGSALRHVCPALVPLTYQQALLTSKN